MENYGVIIRHLRNLAGLDVRATARKIERSIGWLSEIENGRGKARPTEPEFQRIVELLGGTRHRSMFKIWVANQKNRERAFTTFEGTDKNERYSCTVLKQRFKMPRNDVVFTA